MESLTFNLKIISTLKNENLPNIQFPSLIKLNKFFLHVHYWSDDDRNIFPFSQISLPEVMPSLMELEITYEDDEFHDE